MFVLFEKPGLVRAWAFLFIRTLKEIARTERPTYSAGAVYPTVKDAWFMNIVPGEDENVATQ